MSCKGRCDGAAGVVVEGSRTSTRDRSCCMMVRGGEGGNLAFVTSSQTRQNNNLAAALIEEKFRKPMMPTAKYPKRKKEHM